MSAQLGVTLLLCLVNHGMSSRPFLDINNTIVQFGVRAINDFYFPENRTQKMTLLAVISVKKQIISGNLDLLSPRQSSQEENTAVKGLSHGDSYPHEIRRPLEPAECKPMGSTKSSILGGITDIHLKPDDPIVQFGVQAINYFYFPQSQTQQMTLVAVLCAQEQIVSGDLFFLVLKLNFSSQMKECHVKILSPPYTSDDHVLQVVGAPVCNRLGSILGGISAIRMEPKNPIADFAVQAINKFYFPQSDTQQMTLVAVVSAKLQSSNFNFYYLVLELKHSTQKEKCHIRILAPTFYPDNNKGLLAMESPVCHPITSTMGSFPGGILDIHLEPDNPIVQFGVQVINNFYFPQSHSQEMTLVAVIRAQKQIVNGFLYFLSLKLSHSYQMEECHVKILSPPSSSDDRILRVVGKPECNGSISGALEDVDLDRDDPMVKAAVWFINDFYFNQNHSQKMNLVAIISAKVQDSFFYLVLELKNSTQREKCQIKILLGFFMEDKTYAPMGSPVCRPISSITGSSIGGITDIHLKPDDPIVQFGVQAINYFYFPQSQTQQMTLVAVLSAQKQVVSGYLFFLFLKLNYSSQMEECHVKILSPPYTSDDHILQVVGAPVCNRLGSIVGDMADIQLEPENPIVQFGVQAINQFYFPQSPTQNLKLVAIMSARKQMSVNDFYYLVLDLRHSSQRQKCQVKLLSPPFSSDVKDLLVMEAPVCNPISLTGGPIHLKPSNPIVQFGVQAINNFYFPESHSQELTLVAILSTKKQQMLSGALYDLVLDLQQASERWTCEIMILSPPYYSDLHVLRVVKHPVCNLIESAKKNNITLSRSIKVRKTSDPLVQKTLRFAIGRYNNESNSIYYRKAVKIEKILSQVVSGFLFHLRGVQLALTTCMKYNQSVNVDKCPLEKPLNIIECNFDVWVRLWLARPYKMMSSPHCRLIASGVLYDLVLELQQASQKQKCRVKIMARSPDSSDPRVLRVTTAPVCKAVDSTRSVYTISK